MVHSSAEVEYCYIASTATEVTRFSFLLKNLGFFLSKISSLHRDNQIFIYMIVNPMLYARIKHIKVDFHYVYERVALGSL